MHLGRCYLIYQLERNNWHNLTVGFHRNAETDKIRTFNNPQVHAYNRKCSIRTSGLHRGSFAKDGQVITKVCKIFDAGYGIIKRCQTWHYEAMPDIGSVH